MSSPNKSTHKLSFTSTLHNRKYAKCMIQINKKIAHEIMLNTFTFFIINGRIIGDRDTPYTNTTHIREKNIIIFLNFIIFLDPSASFAGLFINDKENNVRNVIQQISLGINFVKKPKQNSISLNRVLQYASS